jgi:hypothetical protein
MAVGFPQPDAAGKHFILICPVTVMPAIEQKSNANRPTFRLISKLPFRSAAGVAPSPTSHGGTLFLTRLESRIVPAIEGKKASFQWVCERFGPTASESHNWAAASIR